MFFVSTEKLQILRYALLQFKRRYIKCTKCNSYTCIAKNKDCFEKLHPQWSQNTNNYNVCDKKCNHVRYNCSCFLLLFTYFYNFNRTVYCYV